MRQGSKGEGKVSLYMAGLIPVWWIAFLTAPCMDGGLRSVVNGFSEAMSHPFKLQWCDQSFKVLVLFTAVYIMSITVYESTARNYRPREEHGSARWGSATGLRRKYADKELFQNKILTRHTAIGLNGRKHMRNLNVLVVGGSGSGKTRSYAKPNVKQYERVDMRAIKDIDVPADMPEININPGAMQLHEMERDALLCPWKYLYGYVASSFPSYRSDFHYRFVLTAIISAFSKASGFSPDVVSGHVLKCFPYLKEIEKRQIRDYSTMSLPPDHQDSLDDVTYSGYRLAPHFINKGLIYKASELAEKNNGMNICVNLFTAESSDYQTCLYCQYKDECIHARREADEI